MVTDEFKTLQGFTTVTLAAGDRDFKETKIAAGELGGRVPDIRLFGDIGDSMGFLAGTDTEEQHVKNFLNGGPHIDDGSSLERKIDASGGIPGYIKLVATGEDDLCLSYFSTVNSEKDFWVWTGDYAAKCNVPWYHSSRRFPAVVDDYRPSCVYLSAKPEDYGRKPMGLTIKLNDFAFPGEEAVNGAQAQFNRYPDTLCKAPGRMQFWKKTTSNSCILYYPHRKQKVSEYQKGLNLTDANFIDVMMGHEPMCSEKEGFGEPWNDIEVYVDKSNLPGAGNFGGVFGTIPADTQPGYGSFGGQLGSIPKELAGKGAVITDENGQPKLVETPPESSAVPANPQTQPANSLPLPPNASNAPCEGDVCEFLGDLGGAPAGQGQSQPPIEGSAGAPPAAKEPSLLPGNPAAGNPTTQIGPKPTVDPAATPPVAQQPTANQPPVIPPHNTNHDPATGLIDCVKTVCSPEQRAALLKAGQFVKTQRRSGAVLPRQEHPLTRRRVYVQELRVQLSLVRDKCVNELVFSEYHGHSARVICESHSSLGPDFISLHERMYCDMCEKVSWPLCEDGVVDMNCFDHELKRLRVRDENGNVIGKRDELHKVYKREQYWI